MFNIPSHQKNVSKKKKKIDDHTLRLESLKFTNTDDAKCWWEEYRSIPIGMHSFCFVFFFNYCDIINVQYCISFSCTVKWLGYTNIYISTLF